MKKLIILTAILTFNVAMASKVPTLSCFGTEPFWGLSIDSKGFLGMSNPVTDGKKFYSKTQLINAAGTSGDFAFQITATNLINETVKLNVLKSECNDGMSDNTYPYSVIVEDSSLESKTLLFGCCK